MIGTRLGPYEITAKLGEGGLGEIYRATDTRLKREVAIRVRRADFAEDKDRLARFEREAQLDSIDATDESEIWLRTIDAAPEATMKAQ